MTEQVRMDDYIRLYPKQREAFGYVGRGYRIFYGGARGGGKSFLGLASALLCSKQRPGLKTYIVRENYEELKENFIDPLVELFPQNVFGYTYKEKYKRAEFSNRSKIIFRSAETESDMKKILGLEFQYLILDEANLHSENMIKRALGSLRNSRVPNFRPTLLMTGNPGGVSDLWFRHHFVEPDYKYWNKGELAIKDRFVFVQSSVYDLKDIWDKTNPDYIPNLESLDDELKDLWLYGKWGTTHGRFFSEWSPDVHTCEPFEIPKEWQKIASIDEGGSDKHPTVVLWSAQDPKSKVVYVYREYVSSEVADDVAKVIKGMQGQEQPIYYVDPSLFIKFFNKHSDESTADVYTRNGIPVIAADNNRINGWRVMKNWLHWNEKKKPKLVFFKSCQNCIQNIPNLLHDKTKVGDCNTKMRDDEADAVRYLLVSGYRYTADLDSIEVDEELPKQLASEAIRKDEEYDRYSGWSSPREYESIFGGGSNVCLY